MVVAVLQAPVLFFDSNPVGRIMNRFSRDIGCLDELLPKTFLLSIQYALMVSTAILVPAATNPWVLLVFVPATFLAVYITSYYLKTSRELKRLESICRSPVFSHVSETLNGLDTIRTRKRQDDFVDRFHGCVEIFFYFFHFCMIYWLQTNTSGKRTPIELVHAALYSFGLWLSKRRTSVWDGHLMLFPTMSVLERVTAIPENITSFYSQARLLIQF